MPFETIQHPRAEFEGDNPVGWAAGTETVVRWNKKTKTTFNGIEPGWVQVDIQRFSGARKACVPECDGSSHPDNPCAMAVDVESRTVSEPYTRDQLNDFIETLRRARDQAFGRDQ